MKWPSLHNSNPKTWKCKLFGCKDEEMYGVTFLESGEKHGIGMGKLTATTTVTTITYRGCSWCLNYIEVRGEERETWPKWQCSCPICDSDGRKEVVI